MSREFAIDDSSNKWMGNKKSLHGRRRCNCGEHSNASNTDGNGNPKPKRERFHSTQFSQYELASIHLCWGRLPIRDDRECRDTPENVDQRTQNQHCLQQARLTSFGRGSLENKFPNAGVILSAWKSNQFEIYATHTFLPTCGLIIRYSAIGQLQNAIWRW